MKKIFVLLVSIFVLAFYSSTASILPKEKLIGKARILKLEHKRVVKPTATIGFTDACGQCWDYTITGDTWDQIWSVANMFNNIYELGWCGYVTPVYPN
jgi:hypothetical protein